MLSVTSLTAYMYCARKLYLQKVLGCEEIPKEFLVRGSIKHRVFEGMNNAEKDLVCSIEKGMDDEHVLDLYNLEFARILRRVILQSKNQLKLVNLQPMDAFKQYIPLFRVEAHLRAANISSFMQKYNVYGEELWLSLTPKIRSEYKVCSQGLKLTGKIDQVQIFPKKLVPVELKTGRAPKEGVWDDHKVQLAAYAMLLEDCYKVSINSGLVRYVDDNAVRVVQINPFLKDQVTSLIKAVNDMLSSPAPPPFNKNENKCKTCGLREICHSPDAILKEKSLNRT